MHGNFQYTTPTTTSTATLDNTNTPITITTSCSGFESFLIKYNCYQKMDKKEQIKLFLFQMMMKCVNTVFVKKKQKGTFIALAAAATEGDETTYNTGGASNIRTKSREIIFHAITGKCSVL